MEAIQRWPDETGRAGSGDHPEPRGSRGSSNPVCAGAYRHRRHVEFVAVHKSNGQHVLVEAKSRHRAGVIGRPGARDTSPDLKFRRLINDAIAKDPNNPLAIFVDTNLPPERARPFYDLRSRDPIVPSKAMTALMESVRKDYGNVDPYNLLVFSNHPQYYSEGDQVPGSRWAGFLSKKARIPVYHEQALLDLLMAVNLYGNVPSHFPPERNSVIESSPAVQMPASMP